MIRSIGAVLAGLLFIVVSTTAIDVVLHAVGFYPPWGQPTPDGPLVRVGGRPPALFGSALLRYAGRLNSNRRKG